MMGTQGGAQEQLFYSFGFDAHVPPHHLLRGIEHFLDLSSLREHLAAFYSHTGRPSIDPELMMRMLVIGYCFGIRSERRLCEEVHLNLAYRWFCRLDHKQRCCPNTPHRRIARSVYEEARDVARTVCETPAYERSRTQRKKVEMLFAHLNRILKLDRLRLRGISGARDEFLIAGSSSKPQANGQVDHSEARNTKPRTCMKRMRRR